jgi:hypothetical protein
MQGVIAHSLRLIITRPARAILILRMALWVALLSLIVKFVSLPRALRIISPGMGKRSANENIERQLSTAIDALLGLNVFIFRPVCWKRAAILHRYLMLHGKPTAINFGLRKGTQGTLDGHAWLEADGRAVLENDFCDYTVTYIFPSNAHCEIELATLAKSSSRRRDRRA